MKYFDVTSYILIIVTSLCKILFPFHFELKLLHVPFDFFQFLLLIIYLLTNNLDSYRISNNYLLYFLNLNDHDKNSTNKQPPRFISDSQIAPSITLCSNIQIEIDPPTIHTPPPTALKGQGRKLGRGDEYTGDRVGMKIQKRTKKINKIRWGKR